MLPSLPDLDPQSSAESARWLYCLEPVDLAGRGLGANWMQPGVPFCVRSRNAEVRNDTEMVDRPGTASLLKIERVLAGPAAECLLSDYVQAGIVEFKAMAGRDQRVDAEMLARLIGRVLPSPEKFDDHPDGDWNLMRRRGAHLAKMLEANEREETARSIIEAMIVSHTIHADSVRDWAGQFLAAASARRLNSGPGRVSINETEIRKLKWVGLEPSQYFDGFDSGSRPEIRTNLAPVTMTLPPEILELLQKATTHDGDRIAMLEAQLAEMKAMIESKKRN
jgi:hypothetical protein